MIRSRAAYLMLFAAACAMGAAEGSPLLQWMGGEPRVVVGEGAAALEHEAAMRICRAIDSANPQTHLVTDAWVMTHPDEAAALDLFVVGTPESNGVLRDHVSLWWRTAEDDRPAAFPVQGLYLFGIGDLKERAAGVIEPCRNPYWIAGDGGQTQDAQSPPTIMIRCAGRFPEGVMGAVGALLEYQLLSGVTGSHEEPGTSPHVGACSTRLFASPPAWARIPPETGLLQLGWHQADRFLIDGLASQIGQCPRHVWRLVLRRTDQPRDAAGLHRRNTAGEVLLCEMRNPSEADEAVQTLLAGLGEVRRSRTGNITLNEVTVGGESVYGGAAGAFFAVENLGQPSERQAMLSLLQRGPREDR